MSGLWELLNGAAPTGTEYYGYPVRSQLYPGEETYFMSNPHVAGMAAEDNQIIFNPYAKGVNYNAVGQNEAARLWMRNNPTQFSFPLTNAQKAAFAGTPYENNEDALRQSILARIISGDSSAGAVTPEQQLWADWLRSNLLKQGK